MEPNHIPYVEFPPLPLLPSISLSDSIRNKEIPLLRKRIQCPPVIIFFSFFNNIKTKDKIKEDKVKSKVRYGVVYFANDDNFNLIGQMTARIYAMTPLSFMELRLELRDQDLDYEEFNTEEPRQRLSQTQKVVRVDDLNID